MTFNEFFKANIGKGIDFDGNYGVQCFDLANQYSVDVVKSKPFIGMGACEIYTNFDNQPAKADYNRYANTSSFVPKKGDIVVWASSLNGSVGHVAIATGEGDTTYFYSYDQNWTGNNDSCTKIKHTYNHVLGVLRPKDQTKVNGKEEKIMDTTGYKKGDKTIGVYAFKKLLMLAYTKKLVPKKLADDSVYGGGTITNVNSLLKKWGYKQTGIAGKHFISKLYNEILSKIK